MEVTIRRAKEGDISAIEDLLSEVNLVHHKIRPDLFNVGRKYGEAALEEKIRTGKEPIFCAVGEDDRVMGYCMTWFEEIKGDPIRTGKKTLYIDDLCVDETVRGQHIGEKLYQAVKEYAKKEGCYNVTLHVWEGNDKAEAFYQKMGLTPQFTCLEAIL